MGTPEIRIVGYAPTVTVEAWGDLPDDHPVHALIGLLTVKWAGFEHNLDRIIWTMMGADNNFGACLTAQYMGPGPRFLSMLALAAFHKLDAKIIGRINRLRGKTFEITEKRNRTTHDVWLEERHSGKTGQFKAMPKDKLTFGVKEADLEDLKRTITATDGLRKDAEGILAAVSGTLSS